MKLYFIEYGDDHMYVAAHGWGDAIARWRLFVADVRDCSEDEVDMDDLDGVSLIADAAHLLLPCMERKTPPGPGHVPGTGHDSKLGPTMVG